MSRLTDLLRHAKEKDPQLGADLEREFKVISDRLAFGLNFERHRPEAVELPHRPIRKGDKVRVLPKRGSTKQRDRRLWRVTQIQRSEEGHTARLSLLGPAQSEERLAPVEDCVVVTEFRDRIYPGLVSTGRAERGGDKPFHTVINGENFHVLEALTYTHQGRVDCIYIDPPYNTGAKDWKYNNDYVEANDLYRHSKWLAMMERRLRLARRLLNPDSSVLIVTIDAREYLRLGLLLEQVFPEAYIQMVDSCVNPKGVVKGREFARVDEYIYFLTLGSAGIVPETASSGGADQPVKWQPLRRSDIESRRHGNTFRPNQFYPIYVHWRSGQIVKVGAPLGRDENRADVPGLEGCDAVFPVRPDGTEIVWGLSDATLKRLHPKGYVKAGEPSGDKPQQWSISYLTSGRIRDIETGKAQVLDRGPDGSVIAVYPSATGHKQKMPTTQWNRPSHNAQHYGTLLLQDLLPGRRFPYPKSLYAVEDCLRFVVKDKPQALVLDFFAGSGTTAHAVMRLNHQDGGRRTSILVTNNEVSADERIRLRKSGLRPGDSGWEQDGICDHITKPRVTAAITGKTPEHQPIEGDYKFTDEFPMSDGFDENAEFFTLTYESPLLVNHNKAFGQIAPLLWLRAGSQGRRIDRIPDRGWDVAESYAILFDLDRASQFCRAVREAERLTIVFIVTDDDRRYQSVIRRLPASVEPVRLYESYLSNFEIGLGE